MSARVELETIHGDPQMQKSGSSVSIPHRTAVEPSFRITEEGDFRITEDGNFRILETH